MDQVDRPLGAGGTVFAVAKRQGMCIFEGLQAPQGNGEQSWNHRGDLER